MHFIIGCDYCAYMYVHAYMYVKIQKVKTFKKCNILALMCN